MRRDPSPGTSAFPRFLPFGILILMALLAHKVYFCADLSEGKAYSVSAYTKACLSALDSELMVTWYRSPELAYMTPSMRYIEEFLAEYQYFSNGNLSIAVTDPSLLSGTANIESLGIVPGEAFPLVRKGQDRKPLYSGFLVEYRGNSRVIPFVLDLKTLEYNMTRVIDELEHEHSLHANGCRTVQLVSGNASSGIDYQYAQAWISHAGFLIEPIPLPVVKLDPEKSLLVFGSTDIDGDSAGAIDSFLDSGGNASFFVSGNAVNTRSDWHATLKSDDELLSVLKSHGFSVDASLLLDVLDYRITMPSTDRSLVQYVEYPFWVTVPRVNMAPAEVLLTGVTSLQFYWPSPILSAQRDPAIIPLVYASGRARTMNAPYNTDPFGKQQEQLFFAGHAVIAACAEKPGRIVVVADEYFPSSLVDYSSSDGNLNFVVNCIEWITGNDSLLSLKERGSPGPAILQGGDGKYRATDEEISAALGQARTVNLAIVPSLLVFLIIVSLIKGRRRR